jgi:hypothetical protein
MHSHPKIRMLLISLLSISAATVLFTGQAQAALPPSHISVVAASCPTSPFDGAEGRTPPDSTAFRTAHGGYIGSQIIGNNNAGTCDGTFAWAPSVTSATSSGFVKVTWGYGNVDAPVGGKNCDYSVYIPNSYAGGLAEYFVYAIGSNGNYKYLFNRTVDQENVYGQWFDLGQIIVPAGYTGTLVALDNLEPARPGWDVAFDAAGFQCT